MPRLFSNGRYANVTATIALVCAMGGTSYAAVTVTGQNIKNNTIKSIDIANNSVASADVKNGSLLKADFKAGQLPAGAKGEAGAPGAAGAKGDKGDKGDQGIPGTAAAKGDKGDKGDPGTPGTNGSDGAAGLDAIPNVTITSNNNDVNTSSTAFVAVPELNQNVTIAGGAPRRLLVTLSGETACYGASGYCKVKVLVDGTEIKPVVGGEFAFDSNDGGSEGASSWESHSAQRYTDILPAGAHSVSVEIATSTGATDFRLDDAVLTTMQVQG